MLLFKFHALNLDIYRRMRLYSIVGVRGYVRKDNLAALFQASMSAMEHRLYRYPQMRAFAAVSKVQRFLEIIYGQGIQLTAG